MKNPTIQLYNGDCTEIMQQLIEDNIKVDLILTDPPYGMTDAQWDKKLDFNTIWQLIDKIGTPLCTTLLFGAEPMSSMVKSTNRDDYKYDWYWIKSKHTGFLHAHNKPLTNVEIISVYSKGAIAHKGTSNRRMTYNPQGLKRIDKVEKQRKPPKDGSLYTKKSLTKKYYTQKYTNYPLQTLHFKPINNPLHPSQKPVDLLEYLVKTYSNPNDTVLDFTMGSGSTGVACMNTNRKFIGIELNKEYYNLSKERINEAKQQTTLNQY